MSDATPREFPPTLAAALALVGQPMAVVERELILATLVHCGGNRTHAARMLGISIRTLRNKLADYTAAGFAVPEAGSGIARNAPA
ncbi:helix-turn-helix domain-containing protein [Chelatococcus daeguensis]|uniref:helix-turn-helix domain-containing protein n=1 Tax=Chelatococcus daeguensis TaxID=444444 RepID=UPI0009ED4BF0|nr:helix-turn-helix domain-containing protein [Chelatococcus daeguensis]